MYKKKNPVFQGNRHHINNIYNHIDNQFKHETPFGYVYQNKFGKSEQDEDQSKNGKNGMLKLEKVDNLMNKMQERTEDFKT